MAKKRCIYCGEEKEPSELSEEHVIPQAIGGALHPMNPFKTDSVCRRCNNFCGLFVDTPFIKSWVTHAGKSENARKHLKFDNQCLLPLQYIGTIPELQHEGRICEYWIGPTGDSVFHFHLPYPEVADMPTLVGPAPNVKKQADPGFVFLFVVATNPTWHPVIGRSVVNQFPKSPLYLGNGETSDGGLPATPAALQDLQKQLKNLVANGFEGRIAVSANYETRFLGKLALGIGHLMLAPEFSTSPDAASLRSLVWGRTKDQKAAAGIKGMGFFTSTTLGLDKALSWPRGHLIALLPTENSVALHARFYDHQSAVVIISSQEAHWRGRIDEKGIIFAIAPGLRRCVGPMSLPDFLAHRLDAEAHTELAELEDEMDRLPPLPPVHLE